MKTSKKEERKEKEQRRKRKKGGEGREMRKRGRRKEEVEEEEGERGPRQEQEVEEVVMTSLLLRCGHQSAPPPTQSYGPQCPPSIPTVLLVSQKLNLGGKKAPYLESAVCFPKLS